ncbi:MAG: hypothetical protein WC319_10495 [Candidatus Paceibacterota bacterium]
MGRLYDTDREDYGEPDEKHLCPECGKPMMNTWGSGWCCPWLHGGHGHQS